MVDSGHKTKNKTRKQIQTSETTKQTTKQDVLRQTNKRELVLHGKYYTMLKKLGTGIYGTTYEVLAANSGSSKQNAGKHMAFKAQKILPEHRKPDTEFQLWREIDFQRVFVTKLLPGDRDFFVRQYEYEIISECQHKQKRAKIQTIVMPKNKWELKIFNIDRSPFCAYFLMDLVDGLTVFEYFKQIFQQFESKLPQQKLVINLVQQFLKCLELLQRKGYSHNDEHFGNLMITSLDSRIGTTSFNPSFDLGGKKIQKIQYQLKLIDYGLVNHPKFKQPAIIQKYQLLYLARPDIYYYTIALRVISDFFTNASACKMIYDISNKLEPKDASSRMDYRLNLLKNISMNHPEFLDAAIPKYSAQYPELAEFLRQIFNTIHDEVTISLIKDPSQPNVPRNHYYISDILEAQPYIATYQSYLTEFVLLKITEEFRTMYTKEHFEYSGYELLDPRMLRFLAPKRVYLDVLGFTRLDELINWAANLG